MIRADKATTPPRVTGEVLRGDARYRANINFVSEDIMGGDYN